MRYPRKSLLLSGMALGLLIGSSQTNAFDPKMALEQQKAQQPTEQQAVYERYRNKQVARINNDGTVTIGNLQWMRCSLGQQWDGSTCIGRASGHNKEDSKILPGLMNAQGGFAGHRDWRLPTPIELASLRVCSSGEADVRLNKGTMNIPHRPGERVTTFEGCDGEYSLPTIDTNLFPETPSLSYWADSSSGWHISFNYGSASSNPPRNAFVRLVRNAR